MKLLKINSILEHPSVWFGSFFFCLPSWGKKANNNSYKIYT